MPPSSSSVVLRPALHSNNKRHTIVLNHITTLRPQTCLSQCRHMVTTETASKPDIRLRPLPPKTSDPLRILFCGSDHFSCASLAALHTLHEAEPHLIESIDVLVRPGKPAGRGLKRIAVGPLFHLAKELNLPLHQRDTFTGWNLPLPGRVTDHKTGKTTIVPHPAFPHRPHYPFNLLIAVSFGLFVPSRILKTLKYGGLNIHPSLLPDLRGPAPIPWSILLNRTHTGCTLQTLHPTKFDHGTILLQTPRPGLPIPPDCTSNDLLATLATEGANMLVQGLRNHLHVPPLPSPSPTSSPPSSLAAPEVALTNLREAPKITKVDLAIDWASSLWGQDHALYPDGQWTASDLARRFRAVGTRAKGLWTRAFTTTLPEEQRLIFEDVEAVPCPKVLRDAVCSIVQIKLAGAHDTAPRGLRGLRYPREVSNVVFGFQPDLAVPQQEFRVPVLVDKDATSVVLPVRVPYRIVDGSVEAVRGGACDAVRVRRIKVEGRASEEASLALKPFWERDLIGEDVVELDYALDVISKRLDQSV